MNSDKFQQRDFWLNGREDKQDKGLVTHLENWAQTGKDMSHFKLNKTNLRGINLVNHGSKDGYNLSNSDLYRANMSHSHLFQLNLTGASLMKADLSYSNLRNAVLIDANLLGVNFEKTKLGNISWGKELIQEKQAKECKRNKDYAQMLDYYQQSEEVYRNLRNETENNGLFEPAGEFFHKEMKMRRMQMPHYSLNRFLSKIVDLFCGYGEKPLRVVLFSFLLILICAFGYFLIGVNDGGVYIGLDINKDLAANIRDVMNCVYYSVVTFTTLGYGDITPVGMSRPLAAFEAFSGAFTIALFVVVFVKKMTR